MSEDNDRDRFQHGYDAGVIVDGEVVFDEEKGRYVLMDEDGDTFDPFDALKSLNGKKVRMTMISFEAMMKMQEMYEATQGNIIVPDDDLN
jgi:hypothetical protein